MKAFVGRFTEAIVQNIGPVATAENRFQDDRKTVSAWGAESYRPIQFGAAGPALKLTGF